MMLLVAEILHQLIGSLSRYLQGFNGFYTSKVVKDFVHQQYHHLHNIFVDQPNPHPTGPLVFFSGNHVEIFWLSGLTIVEA